MNVKRRRPILVASHPRSGTHLVIDLLRKHLASLANWRIPGLPLDHLYLNLERLEAEQRRFDNTLALKIFERPQRPLMKTHFDGGFDSSWIPAESHAPSAYWLEQVDRSHIVYVVRHPMDVMASYQQFLSPIDACVAEMDFFSFLTSPHPGAACDRLGWWQRHLDSWAARDATITVRYEDVIRKTEQVLDRFSETFSEQLSGKKPLLPGKVTSITKTRMDRLTKFSPESTAIVADMSRWPATKWREALTNEQMKLVAERLEVSLTKYGYAIQQTGPKMVSAK